MIVLAVEVLSRDASTAQILIRKLIVGNDELVGVLHALLIVLEARGLFVEELVDRAPAATCSLSIAPIWLILLHR